MYFLDSWCFWALSMLWSPQYTKYGEGKTHAMSVNKEKKKRESKIVYLIFPFDSEKLSDERDLRRTVERLFTLNYIPIICLAHMTDPFNMMRRMHHAYRLISHCDRVVITFEEYMTEAMMREVLFAKKYNKEVLRLEKEVI